jgi:DNA helicase-2/ATP-dependent DNA helicase PcrA
MGAVTQPPGPPGPSADAVLEGLDPEQQEVATALEGPVCVLAGAGTGKTRAVTHRIAYGVRTGAYEPSGVLAVTFTTRAAAEMRSRLARLGVGGVSTRTFHSAALAQVRHLWPRLYGTSFPAVLDDPGTLLADLVAEAGLGCSERDAATEIAWAKVSNVAPDGYVDAARSEGRRLSGASPEQAAALYASYVDALRRAGRVDLEDVLLAAVGVLSSQAQAARLVRQRYRWFVVDEFQDVSGVQMALLDCWLGDRDDVCVVGDPAQAIYGFAGARPEYLTDFPAHVPGTRVLRLTRNYRSTPQVLDAAATVGGADGPPLVPTREGRSPVVVRALPDAAQEVAHVVGRVRDQVAAGTDPSDVAVLVRTRAEVTAVARALRDAGVAVSARGGARFFERPEVHQAVAVLAAASHRSGHPDGLAAATEAALTDAGWHPSRPSGSREAARWDSWAALVRLARSLEASGNPAPTMTDLVDHLRELARAGEEPPGMGVTVATLHATKGQEWSVVHLMGASEGSLPHPSATGRSSPPSALAEERRLLYVGMTRARDHLEVSWSSARRADQHRHRPVSRFLEPLLSSTDASARGSVEIRLPPEPRTG